MGSIARIAAQLLPHTVNCAQAEEQRQPGGDVAPAVRRPPAPEQNDQPEPAGDIEQRKHLHRPPRIAPTKQRRHPRQKKSGGRDKPGCQRSYSTPARAGRDTARIAHRIPRHNPRWPASVPQAGPARRGARSAPECFRQKRSNSVHPVRASQRNATIVAKNSTPTS